MRHTKRNKRHTRKKRKTQRKRSFLRNIRYKKGGSKEDDVIIAGPLGVMTESEYNDMMTNRDRNGVDY